METSVRVPLSFQEFNGFVKSVLDTKTLSTEPVPSPSPPSSLLRRLKARASALSLRKAATAPSSTKPQPSPSLRHAHSCSDILSSSLPSRARSPSLFSCTSSGSKNVLTRSLCSKRSTELRAISNPSSSLSDLFERGLEGVFEKPRRAPRPPIPPEFLEVEDDYKMECSPEPHLDSIPPPVPPKPSRNPHNLTIITPSTITRSLSPSPLTINGGASSPLTPNGEIDCTTNRLSTNLSPYGQNWSPLLDAPLPSATSTTLPSASNTMFFPLPPAAISTSLHTIPSPSNAKGLTSIARRVSRFTANKKRPMPLPLHQPPITIIDENGKESGSGKKGKFLTLWGRLSASPSPTTPKSSITPSPKATSFTRSPVMSKSTPVLRLPSGSSPSPQSSCVSLVFSDDEKSAVHSPSTPVESHFIGTRMCHPYSSGDGERSEEGGFDEDNGCDGDHEGDGDDEPREEEEEENESEISSLPSPCMGVELEPDASPPPYISIYTYPDSDTDPSLGTLTPRRPGPSAGRAKRVGFVTPPPTHPPPFAPLPPAPGDWTLGFGGAPTSSFSFASTQQAMEEKRVREMKKLERDWTLGLDLVVGTGLLMKAPKGVEEARRSGSPFPMLSVESSRGRTLSHSAVPSPSTPRRVYLRPDVGVESSRGRALSHSGVNKDKVVPPTSRRMGLRPDVVVPSRNSFVSGFSSDSSSSSQGGGEEEDEWSERSEWPTTFHRRSRLPSLSSVKSTKI